MKKRWLNVIALFFVVSMVCVFSEQLIAGELTIVSGYVKRLQADVGGCLDKAYVYDNKNPTGKLIAILEFCSNNSDPRTLVFELLSSNLTPKWIQAFGAADVDSKGIIYMYMVQTVTIAASPMPYPEIGGYVYDQNPVGVNGKALMVHINSQVSYMETYLYVKNNSSIGWCFVGEVYLDLSGDLSSTDRMVIHMLAGSLSADSTLMVKGLGKNYPEGVFIRTVDSIISVK